MPKIEPWDMQEGETSKAYDAFCTYRDMGPGRSIRDMAQIYNKSVSLLAKWSASYNWVERAAAWDAEQDRIARIAHQKEIAEMRKRHSKLAESMLEKAAKALNNIPEDEVKPADISRMVEVASKLERISRGDVGEVVEERDGGEAMDPVQIYIPSNNRERGKDVLDDLKPAAKT